MEVYTTSMVPSTSNEPSSLDSHHFDRVCSQRFCGILLWPGSKNDLCDRCLARIEVYNASVNPRDAARAYAKTASRVEDAFRNPKDLKEVRSVAPAVPGSAVCSAPPPKYSLPSPYLLPSLEMGSRHSFEAEIGTKPLRHDSTSMSYQGRRSINPPSSAISVPLYGHDDLRHKPDVYALSEEQDRMQPQLCGICRGVIYNESVCPHCRCDTAPLKEKTRFEQRDYFPESKDVAAESDLEDDLSSVVMSMFSNPDEIIDDTDDTDLEEMELSYPEVTDSGAVEEPQLQPAQESSSSLKRNLPPEKDPQHSNQVVPDLAQNFPSRKETPRNTFRSLKLCSAVGCTGTISSESLATRCLVCVRRDWRSKISRGDAGQGADDGRLSSGKTKGSVPAKQKKKVVTWADEVPRTPASQKMLECTSTIKQLDDDPPVGLNLDKLPSSPTEIRVPIECFESNDPTKSEDLSVFTRAQEDPRASASSTPVEVQSVISIESSASPDTTEVSIFGGSSNLSDLSDSRDDNELDISSADSQEVGPRLPKPSTPLPLASTSLKIRIPPRPGLYVRKCGYIRCERRLPATYRWKSCVICRARSRGYQRIKQNLQGQHSRFEEELLNTRPSTDISVVAGARLCSDRNCTYIIPPFGEYLWKMCALCRLRARFSRKFDNASSLESQEIDCRAKIAERLPMRDKPLPGRCQSLDCGMLLSGDESALDCNQCIARSSSLMNDSTSKQRMLERKAKSIPAHPSLAPSPYPRYKAFPNLLADLKTRFDEFLQAQSVFFLYNAADRQLNLAKAMFIFDAEYSVVALDFDVVGRKDAVDDNVLNLKGEIERMGRIQFSSRRYISILEGGGIAERFICLKQAPVLETVSDGQNSSTTTYMKNMHGELEIAVVPDHSHSFLPGQRTIILLWVD